MKLSNVKISKTVNVEAQTITIDFVEVLSKVKGEKTETGRIIETFTISADDFSDAIQTQALLHGLSQKFGDELACTTEEKDVTTVSEAVTWLADLNSRLVVGKWNAGKRSGNGKVERVDAVKLGGVELPEGVTQEQAMALLKQLGLFKS
jgi:hypothetical protein